MPVVAIGAAVAGLAGYHAVSLVLTVASGLYQNSKAKSAKRKAEAEAARQAAEARASMNLKVNAVSNVGALPVIYGGIVRTGGYIVLQEVSADKKYLYIVIAHAEGECEPVQLYLDGTPYTDPKFKTQTKSMQKTGTRTEERYSSRGYVGSVEVDVFEEVSAQQDLVSWSFFSGRDDQPASLMLTTQLDGKWTPQHRLAGVCYSVVRLEWNPDVWRQVPQITVDLRGKRVIDPRTGQLASSANPVLALRDYLLSERYGRGLPAGDLDVASFIAEANYCDQLVAMGHDNPVPRYAIAGLLDTSKPCLDNVQILLDHMRGSLLYIDGRYRLVLDKADVPVMALNADNLVGKVSIKAAERRGRLNQLAARFVDPARNWEETVVTATNSQWRAEDNGLLLEGQREYPLACDERRARYLTERDLRESRNGWTIGVTALPEALAVMPTDVISFSHESTGWVNKWFRCLSVKPLASGEVELTAVEYDPGLYSETPLSALPPPPATSLPDPFQILPAPTALLATPANERGYLGEVLCRIQLSWQPVLGLVVEYRVRWRRVNETTWQVMSTRDLSVKLPVVPGCAYAFSVAAVSAFGRPGLDATLVADASGPAGHLPDVAGLKCEFGPSGEFIFSWAASADAHHYAVEVRNGAVVRRSQLVVEERFVYTLEANKADGKNRSITLAVKAISREGLISANWAELAATNQPPAALAGLNAWSNSLSIAFTCTPPADVDLAGVVCHLGDTADFAPSPATLAYKGRLDYPTLLNLRNNTPLEVGKTYYLRAAAYDVFGDDGLVWSSSLECKIVKLSAEILALENIGPEQLSPELLTKINSADGATSAVEQVSSKLAATWMVTTDVNGKIAGVKAYNDGKAASFDIVADAFRVSTPGSLAQGVSVFTVGQVAGQPAKVGIRGEMYIDGSIAARALSVDQLQSITASTGELYVTGNLHMTQGAILGGARWGWDWKIGSGNLSQNMYLGPNGLLLGSANAGKYIQYTASDGGLTIAGGMIRTPDGNNYLNLNAGPTDWVYYTPNAAIRKDGFAVFYNVVVRGDVQANSLSGAIVTGGHIVGGTVTADHIVARGISKAYTSGSRYIYYSAPYDSIILVFWAKYYQPHSASPYWVRGSYVKSVPAGSSVEDVGQELYVTGFDNFLVVLSR